MIDSLIFDLDGTLWDTRKETFDAINEIARKYNLEEVSKSLIEKSMGHNNSEIAEMYMPDLDKKTREDLFDLMEANNVKYLLESGGIVYPGVINTLEKLSERYKLFIVSNCGAGYIESFLDFYNLNHLFIDFIAASKEGISKTAAIKRLEKEYNLKKPIYIGDTYGDYNYATKANVIFIHAKYGFNKDLECKYKINAFKELPNYLDKNF